MQTRLLPEAEKELLESAHYYEVKREGLARDFLNEVDCALEKIAETPHTWPVEEGEIRRKLVSRFPHTIYYCIESDFIRILAVAHQKRRPGYWKDRLKTG